MILRAQEVQTMKKVLAVAFVVAIGAAIGNWRASPPAAVAPNGPMMSMLEHNAPANLPVQRYDAI
jgi:hypothetical protein